MKITGKTNIKNRFDIECKDIRTGEVQKYQAHNIVLDQMWTRLVNFKEFSSISILAPAPGAVAREDEPFLSPRHQDSERRIVKPRPADILSAAEHCPKPRRIRRAGNPGSGRGVWERQH